MNNVPLYLKPQAYFEPLFNQWYMWPYLLAPVPAAMNFSNHHLRLMKSFVANAKLHAQALKHQSMVGSSIVACNESDVDLMQNLIVRSEQDYADLLLLSKDIKQLDEVLRTQALGESLEGLYQSVPDNLKGLVELVYDLNNHPSYRLIEGLVYRSDLYKANAQSLCFGLLASERRPFVLSTPRLPDDDHLHIQLPLVHPFTQAIFKMRNAPMPLSALTALLPEQVQSAGGLALTDLLTAEPPRQRSAFTGEGVNVEYMGHAGVLIESSEFVCVIDPVIAYENDADNTHKFTFADLPPFIDAVMITHTHMDHLCIESLIQLKHKIGMVLVPKNNGGSLADPSIKLMLKTLGFANVIELDDMDTVDIPSGLITALPFLGEHADVNIRSKAAWMIKIKDKTILSAADSSNLEVELYKRMKNYIGAIDILFIGMECTGGPLRWLYGSLLTQQISKEANESRRFNGSGFDSAQKIVDILLPQQVYVYALGMEPWFTYFMGIVYNEGDAQMQESQQLVEHCRASGRVSERLFGRKSIPLY